MAIRVDLTGKKFNMLTVVKELGGNKLLCKCDCGKSKNINKGHLLNGDITSCGCVQKSRPAKAKEGYLVNNTYIATIRSGKPSKRSTTGIKGVYWSKTKNKYQAAIRCQGINHELGYFNTLAEAVAARIEAEATYFKPLIDDFNKKRGAE